MMITTIRTIRGVILETGLKHRPTALYRHISFRKDGTYLWDDSKSIETGKYVVSEGEIDFYFDEELGEYGYSTYEYEFKRGQLILIDFSGSASIYERTKCTSLEECMEEYDY